MRATRSISPRPRTSRPASTRCCPRATRCCRARYSSRRAVARRSVRSPFRMAARSVSGYRTNSFANPAAPALYGSFEIASGDVVRARAEYVDYSANQFFTAAAASRDLTAPRLPIDAGHLIFSAKEAMELKGSVLAQAPAGARGGLVDISSPVDIVIGGNSTVAPAGTLVAQRGGPQQFRRGEPARRRHSHTRRRERDGDGEHGQSHRGQRRHAAPRLRSHPRREEIADRRGRRAHRANGRAGRSRRHAVHRQRRGPRQRRRAAAARERRRQRAASCARA